MILEVAKDLGRFGVFQDAVNMGIMYRPHDLEFTDFLLFKWIREERKGNG